MGLDSQAPASLVRACPQRQRVSLNSCGKTLLGSCCEVFVEPLKANRS
jgi:hypothetical protein